MSKGGQARRVPGAGQQAYPPSRLAGLGRANTAKRAAFDARIAEAVRQIRAREVQEAKEYAKHPYAAELLDPLDRLAWARTHVPGVRAVREHFGRGHGGKQSKLIGDALARLGEAGALRPDDKVPDPTRAPAAGTAS